MGNILFDGDKLEDWQFAMSQPNSDEVKYGKEALFYIKELSVMKHDDDDGLADLRGRLWERCKKDKDLFEKISSEKTKIILTKWLC